MTRNYLDILAETIRNNWDSPAFTSGGKIIWNKELQKYRYEQLDNIGFQMIEKRAAMVIKSKAETVLPLAAKQSCLLQQGGQYFFRLYLFCSKK